MRRQPELMREAHRHMPQGVAENYRYWGDDKTVFVSSAKGCAPRPTVAAACGFTQRDRVAIVEGAFHGLYDEMMWKSDIEAWDPASGSQPEVIPFGAGIPQRARQLLDLIQMNDHEGLEALFQTRGEQLACVILEPIIGNAGSISATPAWLARLRELCTQ